MRSLSPLLLLCFLFLPTQALASGLADRMVDTVGDMKRIQLVTGETAQDEVDKLHGKALVAEESVVARYAQAGGRPAEVWVSRVDSEKEARRQTGVMVHKMYENPNSPFKDPRRIDHNGRAVYRFVGMGQGHLIWFVEDQVWWVSVGPDGEQAMLDEFCKESE